jgi:hypothetical protein
LSVAFMTISFQVKGDVVCASRERALSDPKPPFWLAENGHSP